MTGTGTQTDPYIVDNWADYRNAVSQSSTAYIEFDNNAENKIIDFNEIYPEGYSGTITFSGSTKFNGWVFRNFYSTATTALSFSNTGAGISGLTFENFYWQSTSAAYFLNAYESTIFKNCNFSGKIAVPDTYASCFAYAQLNCCALNLSISSLSDTFRLSYGNIGNSDIVLDVEKSYQFSMSYRNVVNSRVSGKISATSAVKISESSSSGYNVISLESNQPLKYSGLGISVYNSDLAEKSSDSSSVSFKACNTEQLKNAAYLYSIGFPIGID